MTAPDGTPPDLRAFHNDVQGHLLVAAAHQEARTAAARCAAALDWLTTAQRAEVERRFAQEHLALTRVSWERTARRGEELRAEYEAVYRALRARLLAGLLLTGALVAAVGCVVLWAGGPH
ncbi:hypothetical protein ACH4C6_07070 [Streptomyces sp. NPDC017943]|uniref:hypothetical protein n=1 Tax=Streptomyces sp. NPDC017943 TaxID=3365019 RepID=UPI003789FF48